MGTKTNLKPLGPPREHYWKVIDMAAAVDVSLVEAWEAEDLTTNDYAGMIERCRRCGDVAKCGRLLEDRPALGDAPAFCGNKPVFERLKRYE